MKLKKNIFEPSLGLTKENYQAFIPETNHDKKFAGAM